jgi:hypothetical protein
LTKFSTLDERHLNLERLRLLKNHIRIIKHLIHHHIFDHLFKQYAILQVLDTFIRRESFLYRQICLHHRPTITENAIIHSPISPEENTFYLQFLKAQIYEQFKTNTWITPSEIYF